MDRLIWSPRAERDRVRIRDYIANETGPRFSDQRALNSNGVAL